MGGRHCVAAALTVLLATTTAHALDDKVQAEALFEEATKAAEAGDWKTACEKYEGSLHLYDSINTAYYLADCNEHIGKNAAAWSGFLSVASRAHAAGETAKEQTAKERAAALEPKIGRVSLLVQGASVNGLAVKRDGVVVPKDKWPEVVGVDPGPHAFEATAPGRVALTVNVDVPAGAHQVVVLPELQSVPKPVVAPEPPKPIVACPDPHGPQRTLGLVVAGIGVVGLGFGGFLALDAKSKYAESDPFCRGDECTAPGIVARDRARNQGNLATIVVGLGAAATVSGVVLWLTGTSSDKPSVSAKVGAGTLLFEGRF